MTSRDTTYRFEALTGLRFIAAFVVLLFHTAFMLVRPHGYAAENIPRNGFVGVTLFFVLSGFILTIAYSGAAGRIDRESFYVARLARVYPLYLAALVVALPLFAYDAAAFSPTHRVSVILSALTLTQAWSPWTSCFWNCPGWSLSSEAFFYLLFPFVLPFFVRRSTIGNVVAIMSFSLLSIVASLAFVRINPDHLTSFSHRSLGPWLEAFKFTPLIRFPEFLVGIATGRVFMDIEASTRARAAAPRAAWAALATITVTLLCAPQIPFPVVHNGLLALPFAVLVCSIALNAGWISRLLSQPTLVLLGNASYAVYLLHVPLWRTMWLCLRTRFGVAVVSPPIFAAIFAAYVTFTIALSILAFCFIEDPLRGRLRAYWSHRRGSGHQSSPA